MAKKGGPSRKSSAASPRRRPGKKAESPRFNPGRDSKDAATGPIIRSLPGALGNERSGETAKRPLWKKILIVIALLAVLGLTWLTCKARLSVTNETGTIKIAGISGNVTIARDALGVPFVKADSEQDAFFGAGYAAASDRLWQMYSTKLAVTGRLAEIAGSKMLPVDVYMRSVGIKRNVDRAINKMSPESRAPLEAYAAGVNAFLATHKHLPIEFILTGYTPEPWTIYDCGYVFGALSFGLALNINEELFFIEAAKQMGAEKAAWLVPTYPDEPIPFAEAQKIEKKIAWSLSPETQMLRDTLEHLNQIFRTGMPASNNWAIAGSKTRGGKAILANDTHLLITMPALWYMMSIESPTYTAAGVTIAGQPFIQLGYNGKIAWGATMVEADCQDLFIETIRSENGQTLYLKADNTWAPVRELKEKFKVRFGRDKEVTLRFTGNGPLISDAVRQLESSKHIPLVPVGGSLAQTHLAMRWTLQDGDTAGIGIYEMGRAQTMAEFRRAAAKIQSIYLNLVYSDGDNIAWQTTGRIPVRSKGTGQLPSIAAEGYRWKAYLPFDRQPHKENPEEGFLVTANERTVAKGDERKISGVWYSPERAERIRMLLAAKDDWTGADTRQMQMDLYSRMAEKTLAVFSERQVEIKNAIARLPEKKQKRARAALDILTKFDNVMSARSQGAAVMGAFYHTFTRNVFGDELVLDSPLWKAFIDTNLRSYSAPQDHILGRDESPFFDNVQTAEKETKADMIALSLADAYEFCADEMGSPDKWRWEKLHKIYWRNDTTKEAGILSWYMNHGPVSYQGDSHTINVSHYAWGESFETLGIPAMRFVVDFNEAEPAQLMIHSGVSGNPSSEHYRDQIQLFLKGGNNALPMGSEAKQKQYSSVLKLEK
ncbi:MAG: acyl-homoserine-lactone acylase QuiP [Turneriella sp.]